MFHNLKNCTWLSPLDFTSKATLQEELEKSPGKLFVMEEGGDQVLYFYDLEKRALGSENFREKSFQTLEEWVSAKHEELSLKIQKVMKEELPQVRKKYPHVMSQEVASEWGNWPKSLPGNSFSYVITYSEEKLEKGYEAEYLHPFTQESCKKKMGFSLGSIEEGLQSLNFQHGQEWLHRLFPGRVYSKEKGGVSEKQFFSPSGKKTLDDLLWFEVDLSQKRISMVSWDYSSSALCHDPLHVGELKWMEEQVDEKKKKAKKSFNHALKKLKQDFSKDLRADPLQERQWKRLESKEKLFYLTFQKDVKVCIFHFFDPFFKKRVQRPLLKISPQKVEEWISDRKRAWEVYEKLSLLDDSWGVAPPGSQVEDGAIENSPILFLSDDYRSATLALRPFEGKKRVWRYPFSTELGLEAIQERAQELKNWDLSESAFCQNPTELKEEADIESTLLQALCQFKLNVSHEAVKEEEVSVQSELALLLRDYLVKRGVYFGEEKGALSRPSQNLNLGEKVLQRFFASFNPSLVIDFFEGFLNDYLQEGSEKERWLKFSGRSRASFQNNELFFERQDVKNLLQKSGILLPLLS